MTSRIAVLLWVAVATVGLSAAADPSTQPVVTVQDDHGLYSVAARFVVSQPASVALAVLTDYDHIARFMPGVKTSVVIDRGAGRATVEQEVVSRFMLFSKRVYLTLDIVEGTDTVRFRDRSGRSFAEYEGAWTVCDGPAGTVVTYRLTARPSFDVPKFLLERLLEHDSLQMIAALRREMDARTGAPSMPWS